MFTTNHLLVNLNTNWKEILESVLEIEEIDNLDVKIFPPKELIFNAFNYFNFEELKVVFIGQDVYHNERNGIAEVHGLCFSVQESLPIPHL